jgi:hypothetical protein
MGDVLTSGLNEGLTLSTEVVLDKLRQVIDFSEKRNPTVIAGVVRANLCWSIVTPQLEGLRQVPGILIARRTAIVRRWNSRCHLNYFYSYFLLNHLFI